jgi:hypothetical protein
MVRGNINRETRLHQHLHKKEKRLVDLAGAVVMAVYNNRLQAKNGVSNPPSPGGLEKRLALLGRRVHFESDEAKPTLVGGDLVYELDLPSYKKWMNPNLVD